MSKEKKRSKNPRDISLERAEELKSKISDYISSKKKIQHGLALNNRFSQNKQKILDILGGRQKDWDDYMWHLSNRIDSVETLSKILNLSGQQKETIKNVEKRYRWAISPYYASLMDPEDKYCPVRLQGIPSRMEIEHIEGDLDPMLEQLTNPAGSITRRYPDRLIINVTNECAMYCRHCQRRRNIGEIDRPCSKESIQESIDYIASNSEIRDVLITGGDPLTLKDSFLEFILKGLRDIEHVEIIRIGSRTPVTLPQRITGSLVNMLRKYHPLYINTHVNHPKEITPDAKRACEKLADAGIPLGNQAVLLNGINNDKHVMKALNQDLLRIRVRPYYIFHSKHVKGTTHFNTSVNDGIEIMEHLRGYTSGLAIPTYIINAPGGLGKTPILPQYLISSGKDYITIRTWEGKIVQYENHETKPFQLD